MARASTSYGQFHVLEPYENMQYLHQHDGITPLVKVDWEPKNGVLDQQDLMAQGIDTSQLVPGAPKVDALGSCTANANASALSLALSQADYLAATGASSYTDTVSIEKFAIVFYHDESDLTGKSTSEWPPSDKGSSGPYIVLEDQDRKYIAAHKSHLAPRTLSRCSKPGQCCRAGPSSTLGRTLQAPQW